MSIKNGITKGKRVLGTAIVVAVTLSTIPLMAYFFYGPNATTERPLSAVAGEPADQKHNKAKALNQQVYDNAHTSLRMTFSVPLPPSLSDIHHDAKLLTDANGNLVPNEEIKHLFEFYLSAIGEAPLDQIITRIQHELNTQLTPPALDQSLALLKRYIDYKIDVGTLENDSALLSASLTDIERIKHQKSQLRELRARYFDPSEYQPLFEQEEIYDNYMLRRLAIVSNSGLGTVEKNGQLESLEASLPQAIQAVRNDVSRHANLYNTTTKMKNNGASKEELFQLRALSLGTEAANALAQLDQQRAHWKQRVDGFNGQKERIVNSGLSSEDQTLAINDLIESQFAGSERTRIKAISSQTVN